MLFSEDGSSSMDFRSGEFGIVGADQLDETHLDKRGSGCYSEDSAEDNDEDNDQQHDAGGRICFPQDKMYGRQRELETLQAVYKQLITKKAADLEAPKEEEESKLSSSQQLNLEGGGESGGSGAQVVFISGYSGCGKTRLVKEAVQQFAAMDSTKKPILIHGKYEELRTGDLYKGISEAFGYWYSGLPKESRDDLKFLRGELEEAVGDDIVVLADLIPSMMNLVNEDDDEGSTSSKASSNVLLMGAQIKVNVNKSRIHFVLQSFVKSLCKHMPSPVILFIDDLQWAEAESLDLLKSLVTDVSIPDFLFVGAYRKNEVSENHPLTHVMADVQNEKCQQVTRLDLCDLSREHVRSFIGDTLDLEEATVQPLADALFSKTLGNIFFTMQALEQLVRRNALYYDMMVFQWQWVLSTEQLEELLSNDVVEMVKSKLEDLEPALQKTLVVAAQLRHTFDLGTLAAAIDTDIYGPRLTKEESIKLLDKAIEEGLIFRKNGNAETYTFFHDRIREAAGALVVGDTRDKLLFHIGNVLAQRGTSKTVGEDWMLFAAAHHLNSLPLHFHDEEAKVGLARLNLQAAKASLGIAAFAQAGRHAEKGMSLLPAADRWTLHTDMCHQLYATAAEALRHTGDIAKMEKYSNELLAEDRDCPQQKKFPVYYNLAVGLFYGAERHAEARAIMLQLLEELDCRFPKSTMSCMTKTASHVLSLPFAKRRRTAEELDRIDFMSDPAKFKCMMILDKLFDICYLMNDETLLPLVIFRAHEYTVKYGFCIYSPKLIAAISLFFVLALNDLQGGAIYANYALKLMEKCNHRPIECGTMMLAYFMGLHWTIPVRQCIEPMRHAYMVGLNTGDVENSRWNIFNYVLFSFQAGVPLSRIDAALAAYLPEMEEMSLNMIATCAKSFWNLTLTLMGRPTDHLCSDINDHMSEIPVANLIAMAGTRIKQAYCGDYESCAISAVKVGSAARKSAPGGPVPVMDMCVCALSCYVMAQRTGKSQYKKEAKGIHSTFAGWAKQGNPNIKHWNVLLDAESNLLKRKSKAAIKSYEAAVALATSGGYIHDAAIACERWGEYLLTVQKDSQEAKMKLRKSLGLWREWGAMGKAEKMKEKYPELLE